MISKPIPAKLLDDGGNIKTWTVSGRAVSSDSIWNAFCQSVLDGSRQLNTHAFAERLDGVGAAPSGRITDRGLQILRRAGVLEFVQPPARLPAANQSPESLVAHGEYEASRGARCWMLTAAYQDDGG